MTHPCAAQSAACERGAYISLLLLVIGPEREIAPSTTALRSSGDNAAIGAGSGGFLSVWRSTETNRSYVTRLDAEGRPIDSAGIALPGVLWNPAVGWNGSEYVIAAMSVDRGGVVAMRVRADGTIADAEPRLIAPLYFASDIHLAFDGTALLLTWVEQSGLTQSISGALLEPDLDAIKSAFAIDERDVTGLQFPLDHDASSSLATDGRDFLLTWENVRAPESFTFTIIAANGEVSRGATIRSSAPLLQPSVIADRAGFIALWHDRGVIHGDRVGRDGTSLTTPATLVRSNTPITQSHQRRTFARLRRRRHARRHHRRLG